MSASCGQYGPNRKKLSYDRTNRHCPFVLGVSLVTSGDVVCGHESEEPRQFVIRAVYLSLRLVSDPVVNPQNLKDFFAGRASVVSANSVGLANSVPSHVAMLM